MLSSIVHKCCKVVLLVGLMICCLVQFAFADDVMVADNNVPSLTHAQFIGGGWIRASVSGLGDVEIYVPFSSKGSWGLTSDNYLCNINSSSVSGIMFDSNGTQYTFSCSGYSIPRYRLYNSSGYQYNDMYALVYQSNLDVATSFPLSVTPSDGWPYICIAMLGVISLCLMRFKR